MRTTIIVTFIMTLGLVVSDVYAEQNQSAPANTFSGVPCNSFDPAATVPQTVAAPTDPDALTIVPIATDLYLIAGGGGNVTVFVTPAGTVVVDGKLPNANDALLACVTRITSSPIEFVVGTHHHGDHIGGIRALSPNARIVTHENTRTHMLAANHPTPDLVFTAKTSLFLTDTPIEVYHFGNGHTDGDAVVLFPTERVLHAGDLFVQELPFIDYANGGNSADWIIALGGILALDFDVVIPGHGLPLQKRDVQIFRDRLLTLRTRATQLVRRGVSPLETLELLETGDLGWTLAPDAPFVEESFPEFYNELVVELETLNPQEPVESTDLQDDQSP